MSVEERNPLITKYRPTKIEDLIGQERVITTLRGCLKSGDIPNAFLLVGATGTGKTTISRLIARYVMCETLSACGKCLSCQKDILNHPDYREVNAAESGGKDDIRSLITMARNRPQVGGFRVIVLDEVHKATPQALEALLKPLEEPPERTLWILATTEAEMLKPTLRNRCNTLTITPVDKDVLATFLMGVCKKEKLKLDKETQQTVCSIVAESSGGFIRESLSGLHVVLNYIQGLDEIPEDTDELKKLILSNALQVSTATTVMVATKILLSAYTGQVKGIMSALADMDDPIPTVNKMMQFSTYALDSICGVTGKNVWHTPENRKFWELLSKKLGDKSVLSLYVNVLTAVVNLRGEMQKFAVPERNLIAARMTEVAVRNKPQKRDS
jgi:DNA polymerase-3 subunit gamma/tau